MRNILLVYKRSTYSFYVSDPNHDINNNLTEEDIDGLRESHFANEECILNVERVISEAGIPYKKVYRANITDAKDCDLVVAVGGDGTFIEASRSVTTQQILGVNSDPSNSFGNYCKFSVKDLKKFLQFYHRVTVYGTLYPRMIISMNNRLHPFPAMNDVFIHHACPAGLTRYIIKAQKDYNTTKQVSEDHACSGMWVSTAAGSTGAIASHGHESTYPDQKYLLYQTVGLNKLKKQDHMFESGSVDDTSAIQFVSKMREGKVFIDGSHVQLDFSFNSTLEVRSGKPINFLDLEYTTTRTKNENE